MERRCSTPNASRASPSQTRCSSPPMSRRGSKESTPVERRGSTAPKRSPQRTSNDPVPRCAPVVSSSASDKSPKKQRSGSVVSKRAPIASSCSSEASPQRQRQRADTIDSEETFIRVVARVRPKLPHEVRASDGVEVDVRSSSLTLTNSRGEGKKFYVDDVFDSRQEQGSQEHVFSKFGRDFVNHALNGYNICMFAYGHTGSGKTHTMLGDRGSNGNGTQAGILPRFLNELFAAHAQDPTQSEGRHYSCEFYEVYSEQIKDLLVPAKSGGRTRKVHVHPKHGVRVENLTMSVVRSAEDALQLVEFGNQMRAVAATTMNARSSRSHVVFTFKYEQQTCDGKSCRSTATFVDLAGREDQSATQNHATQFREMCYINTSLFHLASVITKLAQGSLNGRSLADFRNSKLTLLLSPALIGNSRTALIATVTPLSSLIDDSLSTMNFAASVKKIMTRPVINNKAPNTLVAELEAEVRQLHSELAVSQIGEAEKERALSSAHALIGDYKRCWEEASEKSQELQMTRKKSLRTLGLAVQGDPASCDSGGKLVPFFTKLFDDPAIQGHCNYFLRDGTLRIGSDEKDCAIVLQGLGILPQMCEVRLAPSGSVVIELLNCGNDGVPRVLVDGSPLSPVDSTRTISHGTCIFLGYSHAFRFVAATHDMALAVGSTDACGLARSTLQKLDVTSAVSEIVDDAGEQFKEILPYISHLSTRVTDDTVQSFLSALHRNSPLIDEANLITKEVFGADALHFELQALTNVFNFSKDVPELVVCLLEKVAASTPTITHERRQSCEATSDESDTHHSPSTMQHRLHRAALNEPRQIGDNSALLYVWSLDKFLWRLNAIREIYQEGSEAKDKFASTRRKLAANPDQNPWREIASGEMQLLKERSSSKRSASANLDERWPEQLPPWQSQASEDSCSATSSSFAMSPLRLDAELCSVSEQPDMHSALVLDNLQQSTLVTALGAKVESLSAQVLQLQGQLLRQGADSSACSTDEGPDKVTRLISRSTDEGSDKVTRWLSQVGEFHNTLQGGDRKVASQERASHLSASTSESSSQMPPARVTQADEVSQNIHNFRTDLAKLVREELKDQLRDVKPDGVSSSGSTSCSSGRRSACRTRTDSCNSVVFHSRPPRSSSSGAHDSPGRLARSISRVTSPSRPDYGPPMETRRSVSPASKRPSLVTQRHYAASSGTRSWATGVSSQSLASAACDKRLTPRPHHSPSTSSRPHSSSSMSPKPHHSPPTSPSRRLVGPYPTFSWKYYEVLEPS